MKTVSESSRNLPRSFVQHCKRLEIADPYQIKGMKNMGFNLNEVRKGTSARMNNKASAGRETILEHRNEYFLN